MNPMICNFLNGNIAAARQQAKRHGARAIREALIEQVGYSFRKATLTADFLKTGEGWQECCDAE